MERRQKVADWDEKNALSFNDIKWFQYFLYGALIVSFYKDSDDFWDFQIIFDVSLNNIYSKKRLYETHKII